MIKFLDTFKCFDRDLKKCRCVVSKIVTRKDFELFLYHLKFPNTLFCRKMHLTS